MLNVVFVNYGAFDNNSGNHIANFANRIVDLGHTATVVANGDAESIDSFHRPKFACVSFDDIAHTTPRYLVEILRRPNTIIHCWTPRQVCENIIRKMREKVRVPYFIHFEDNEFEVTDAALQTAHKDMRSKRVIDEFTEIPEHLTHPVRCQNFIRQASGITGIVEAIREIVPSDIPFKVLEPGVDPRRFISDFNRKQSSFLRRYLYIPDDHNVVVYPGNMHQSNQRDMFSLYLSVHILKQRGRKVTLLRTGTDYVPHLDISMKAIRKSNITELGQLSYDDLMAVLKIADFFVQPGRLDQFNRFRLPSKIPEFLSLGRPTIIPKTNIGLKLRHREEAILMDRGDARDIASSIEQLIDNPTLVDTLSAGARHYAVSQLSWEKKTLELVDFYDSTCSFASHRN